MAKSKKDSLETNKITIQTYLKPKTVSQEDQEELNKLLYLHPSERSYLTNTEYKKLFSPNSEELKSVKAYAKSHELDSEYDKATRSFKIHLTDQQLLSQSTETKGRTHLKTMSSQGDVRLNNLQDAHEKLAAEEEKLPHGFIKENVEKRGFNFSEHENLAQTQGTSVLEIASAYNFPEGDGEGQCVGIIELGGQFTKKDLQTYFKKCKVAVPKIEVVGSPSKTPPNENVEVTADIQIIGALLPKAKIVIYYGNSILEAVKLALTDSKNKLNVISISWAGSEDEYSQVELKELNQTFYEAALKGITVVASSGDYGAYNNKTYPNVNVPVNFPFVLGCGGTQITLKEDKIIEESIWNSSQQYQQIGTGGGFSGLVARPSYQDNATNFYLKTHPQYYKYSASGGRSIPDVAANASDVSGYAIYFEGKWIKLGGTSLSTPLWAALVARINQNLGYNLGFINPFLYQLIESEAFNQVLVGNNNLYVGGYGWNPCTGLGTPNGSTLLELLKK